MVPSRPPRMISSITLKNYKSFGEPQTVPLEPITVLVGPNNSGKSSFMSVGQFLRNAHTEDLGAAITVEGGRTQLAHRPVVGDGQVEISWTTHSDSPQHLLIPVKRDRGAPDPMSALTENPFVSSTSVALRVDAMREESPLSPNPSIATDGSGIAAVVMNWRSSLSPQALRLDDLVSKALPEIKHVLALLSETPGRARLVVQQRDGEQFDARRLSDGVLFFLGLVVHALNAPVDSVLFIEDPETGIHPRRISQIADLLRAVAAEGRQIVLSTHSPTLLDAFRDQHESIVLFRRGLNGTRVKRLTEVAELMRALDEHDARPGAMLADGFFNEHF